MESTSFNSIGLQDHSQLCQIERKKKEIERQKLIKGVEQASTSIILNPIFDSNKKYCLISGSYGYNPNILSKDKKDESGVLLDKLSCLAETAYKLDAKDLFNKIYRFFASNKIFGNTSNIAEARMSHLWDSYIRLQFVVAETTAAQL